METHQNNTVNRESNNALYSQLEDIIHEQIETGQLKPGQAISSERELSRIYGLSRMTVRRALDRLVSAGFLTRVSGKGTYVSEPKMSFSALSLEGLREQAYKMGRNFESNIITFEKVIASGSVLKNLDIVEETPVYKIERVFFADDIPVSMHRSFIPCDLAPDLTDKDLQNESLYSTLHSKYQLEFDHATEMLETTLAKPSESLILGIPTGSPMLLLRITMFNEENRPVEYVKVLFRGDKVQLTLVV